MMGNFDLSTILLLILLAVLGLGLLWYLKLLLDAAYSSKKAARSNSSACKEVLADHTIRLWTDYFWSKPMRASWIGLFLVFSIALGFAIASIWSIISSILFIVVSIFFVRFAYRSYHNFQAKAAEQLKIFDEQVDAAICKEISFEGDNIQSFSDEDQEFDTKPRVFSFPVITTKILFPPFGKDKGKKPIISTKKLDFLILSREYFSICKNSSTFDLLNPKRGNEAKKCAEVAGSTGECHEYYYSQMQNVQYDDTKECIRIIYNDDIEDVEFNCKKAAGNRKPAMKALKEKLRLTERQKLNKIQEHQSYEDLKDKRSNDIEEDTDSSEKEED